MFENENESVEQTQSDVGNSESSSETPSQSAPSQPSSAPVEQSAEAKQDAGPFHTHPRWIEQQEKLKTEQVARQALETQVREMQARLAQPAPTVAAQKAQDALLERLKGIDPEFGQRFEELDKTRSELEELRQWRQNMESQNLRQQAYSSVNNLHEQNKVAAEDRPLYEQILKARVQEMPNARLEDLPAIYKDVHELFSKRYEAIRRTDRESYAKAKTDASRTPASQPKGQTVQTPNGEEWSKDPDIARQQAVSRIVKSMKANQEI